MYDDINMPAKGDPAITPTAPQDTYESIDTDNYNQYEKPALPRYSQRPAVPTPYETVVTNTKTDADKSARISSSYVDPDEIVPPHNQKESSRSDYESIKKNSNKVYYDNAEQNKDDNDHEYLTINTDSVYCNA